MSMLNRFLACTAVAFAVCCASAPTQQGRTLTQNEMHGILGGWPVDRCCIDYGWCDGTAQACSNKHTQEECYEWTNVTFTNGNSEKCLAYHPDTTCNESVLEYTCKTIVACEWDGDPPPSTEGTCKLSMNSTTFEMTESCHDNGCD